VASRGRMWRRTPAIMAAGLCALVALAAIVLTASASPRMANGHSVIATGASQLSVNEAANLRLISHHRGLLVEEGNSSGTPGGRLAIRVNVSYEHTTRAAISFTAYPKGGTVSGQGEVPFYASGPLAYFSGTLHSVHGTGRYAHASTRGISIKGTVQRTHNYAISVRIAGTLAF
jgi:hypothetical protein